MPDVRGLDDAVQCDQGADARAAIAFAPYRLQAGNVFDIDDALGSENEILHEAEEIGPTSEDFGIAPVRGEQAKSLFHRVRTYVLELNHAFSPFCSPNAASTRAGVRGSMGTRTPIALATALLMAAPGEMTGGSPRPTTPRLSYLSAIM